MSNIRRDYTNKDRPYLTAEILVRKTIDEMRSAMVFNSYMKFRDDLTKHIKDNYERKQDVGFPDPMPQTNEAWLNIYITDYYKLRTDDEVKHEYIERVIRNNTVNYE